MEFVLFYRGPLRSDGGIKEKQSIRRALHRQLKQLWQQKPLKRFSQWMLAPPQNGHVSSLRSIGAFVFAPLVIEELAMHAELHITFMRPEEPGSLITPGGDIDNRLKTLFDALRLPKTTELPAGDAPLPEEDIFYCLLEDDNLITAVTVQTERLLDADARQNEVILLIRVRTRVLEDLWGNMGLG